MRRRYRSQDEESDINITPLLDVVFILLIFFIVTTSFVKEKGLDVSRPSNDETKKVETDEGPIVVKIDGTSQIRVENRLVEDDAVRANLERARATKPESPMIIAAHPDAETDTLVIVMDAANLIGIENVNVATTEQGSR